MMSENAEPTTCHPVSCYWEGSHVRTSLQPVREPVWRVSDPACFMRLSVPYARWSPPLKCSLWRTSQRSIAGGWIEFSGRLSSSGILRNGALYPHKEWALLIAASGGFLSVGKPEESAWPTPTASSGGDRQGQPISSTTITAAVGRVSTWPTPKAAETGGYQRDQRGNIYPTLTGAVGAAQAWPTPDAGVFNYAESPASWDKRRERLQQTPNNGNGAGRVLAVEVKRTWPTMLAGDAVCAGPNQHTASLGRSVRRSEGNARLSPSWVEALMGFPPGWTSPPTDGQPPQDHNTAGSPPERAPDSHTTETD
jgi:hypothetical protein